MPDIRAFVFDAYGTLFDVHSVVDACREVTAGGTRTSGRSPGPPFALR
jgi:2-haloacid dehalogenase